MPEAHARLSPSAAHRWINCPGSLSLTEKLPRTTNKFAEEGTAAHELAEKALQRPVRDVYAFEGDMSSNGFEFTHAMCEFVETYVKTVENYLGRGDLFVERRVDFSDAVDYENSFGTADAIIITEDEEEIQIHDLKYGSGVKVEAEQNDQLLMYALGALYEFHLIYPAVKRVRLVIHQPRMYSVSEWDCSIEDLLKFGDNARAAADMATKYADNPEYFTGDEVFTPGKKQCQWCEAKGDCRAFAKFNAQTISEDFEDITDINEEGLESAIAKTQEISNEELAQLMPLLDMVVDWTKAIRGRVLAELSDGNDVPGYKLVEGKRPARAWTDKTEVEEVMKSSMRLKQDEMYKREVISPTQAEKLLKKNNPRKWKKLITYIRQGEGNPSVALASDKRPALDLTPEDNFAEINSDIDDLM